MLVYATRRSLALTDLPRISVSPQSFLTTYTVLTNELVHDGLLGEQPKEAQEYFKEVGEHDMLACSAARRLCLDLPADPVGMHACQRGHRYIPMPQISSM